MQSLAQRAIVPFVREIEQTLLKFACLVQQRRGNSSMGEKVEYLSLARLVARHKSDTE